jgi:hypothetical protein
MATKQPKQEEKKEEMNADRSRDGALPEVPAGGEVVVLSDQPWELLEPVSPEVISSVSRRFAKYRIRYREGYHPTAGKPITGVLERPMTDEEFELLFREMRAS